MVIMILFGNDPKLLVTYLTQYFKWKYFATYTAFISENISEL